MGPDLGSRCARRLRRSGAASGHPAGAAASRGVGDAPLRLTLPEATALALRQQPTIRSAQGSLTAAQSRVPQARSFYFPRFDLQAGVQTSEFRSATTNNRQRSESTFATITGRQLIYDFGKTSALVDEAQAGSRVASGELERVRDLVVQNVRQSYFNLLQARRLVGVADAALARSELNLRSARGFFDVGTKPKSDVTRAEVEVANARVDVIRARNLVRFAETSLANALGLEATVPIEIDDILTYEPVTLDSAQLLAEALGNRPELRQSQSRLDAARAQLAGARARYLPDLTVNGSAGMSSDDAVVSTDGVSSVAFADTWSITRAADLEPVRGLLHAEPGEGDPGPGRDRPGQLRHRGAPGPAGGGAGLHRRDRGRRAVSGPPRRRSSRRRRTSGWPRAATTPGWGPSWS